MFFCQRAVGLQHERDRFPQVGPGLSQGSALRIRAGKFLNEGDVAFLNPAKNRGEPQASDASSLWATLARANVKKTDA